MAETIYITNNEPLLNSQINLLRSFGDEQLNATLEYCTDLMGTSAELYAIVYPPQREPRPSKPRYSKKTGKELKPRKRKQYRRTGRLGANLTHSKPEMVEFLEWFTKVGTDVEYSPYVVGEPDDDPGQAWMHVGVWTPMITNIRANLPAIKRVVFEEIQRRLNSAFAL